MRSKLLFYFSLVIAIVCFSLCFVQQENVSIHRFVFNRAKPICGISISYLDWSDFLAPEFDWMNEQIKADLTEYTENRPNLNETAILLEEKGIHFIFLKVLNQKIHILHSEKTNRANAVIDGFIQLSKRRPLPNVEFIVCLEDTLSSKDFSSLPPPLFLFAKNSQEKGFILIPDFTCFASKDASYAWETHIAPLIRNASKHYPWNKKKSQAIWRGATTGIDFSRENWFESPRVRLSLLSLKIPSLLDARFTYLTQLPLEGQSLIKKMLPMAPFLSPPEHLNYKYLICMDGNTSSYPGLHWRLLSNSTVLKQDSTHIQWYYRGLIPYRDFIPIKSDLSNIKDAIEYLKAHDDIARQIAKNGQEFAKKNLSSDACYYYLDKVLIEYAKTFFPEEYEAISKDLLRSSAVKLHL